MVSLSAGWRGSYPAHQECLSELFTHMHIVCCGHRSSSAVSLAGKAQRPELSPSADTGLPARLALCAPPIPPLARDRLLTPSLIRLGFRCAPGHFQNQTNQLGCIQCALGFYAPRDAHASCDNCLDVGNSCGDGQYDTCGTAFSKFASAGICLGCSPGTRSYLCIDRISC